MFVGIDGGGTGCRARLVDHHGRTLGEGVSGSANLTLGVEIAAASVCAATAAAFAAAGLSPDAQSDASAGLGLAGANVASLAAAFEALPLPFRAMRLASDAVTACLGAHAGRDGAILILGTGSQGLSLVAGVATAIGGWGFLLSDAASGAALGRSVVRSAIAAVDGLGPRSPLTDAVMDGFDHDPARAVVWAGTAAPRDYGAFAPLLFQHGGAGDPVATDLLRDHAAEVDALIARLVALGACRIALMGGLARPYRPWLAPASLAVLVEPAGNALDGAIRLARGEGGAP